MLVVGFDTATPAVSVALHDGDRVVAQAFAVDARRHSELLMPMIAKVMADAGASRADLGAVAVGVGPGPYTGLRVGVVTARVLGSVLGVPVHGLCSLDIIAASAAAARPGRAFLVATDARRKEVYWARYDQAGRRVAGPERRPGQLDPARRGSSGGRDRRAAVPGGVRRGDRSRISRRGYAVPARRRFAGQPRLRWLQSGLCWLQPRLCWLQPRLCWLRAPAAAAPGRAAVPASA